MTLTMKALVWQLAVWLLSILILFLPAGTLLWPAGWTFLVLFFGFVGWLSLWMLSRSPDLLAERLTILKAGQPMWDQIWLLCFYLLSLIWLALMSLDAARLHFSRMPVFLQVIGLLLLLCSLYGIFVTIRENQYLSPVVRLQAERGQTVISSGPYQHIRHPLYASAFLFLVGAPLLLGSWFGFALVPLFTGLMIYRAMQEERLLRHALPGYDTYMSRVTYRFIPHVW